MVLLTSLEWLIRMASTIQVPTHLCERIHDTATLKKGFFCKVGLTGEVELRRNDDYFYQVHREMFLGNFIVWTHGFSVEQITFNSKFWEEAKMKLIVFDSG